MISSETEDKGELTQGPRSDLHNSNNSNRNKDKDSSLEEPIGETGITTSSIQATPPEVITMLLYPWTLIAEE